MSESGCTQVRDCTGPEVSATWKLTRRPSPGSWMPVGDPFVRGRMTRTHGTASSTLSLVTQALLSPKPHRLTWGGPVGRSTQVLWVAAAILCAGHLRSHKIIASEPVGTFGTGRLHLYFPGQEKTALSPKGDPTSVHS